MGIEGVAVPPLQQTADACADLASRAGLGGPLVLVETLLGGGRDSAGHEVSVGLMSGVVGAERRISTRTRGTLQVGHCAGASGGCSGESISTTG
jgi:hypothetical protein